jgi:cadherin-like protein
MKTGLTSSLHHHLFRGPFATLLMSLACPAATSIFQNHAPTAENLSVVAAASDLVAAIISTPIVLKGTDPDGDVLTFRIVSPPSHGDLGGTASQVPPPSASTSSMAL